MIRGLHTMFDSSEPAVEVQLYEPRYSKSGDPS